MAGQTRASVVTARSSKHLGRGVCMCVCVEGCVCLGMDSLGWVWVCCAHKTEMNGRRGADGGCVV